MNKQTSTRCDTQQAHGLTHNRHLWNCYFPPSLLLSRSAWSRGGNTPQTWMMDRKLRDTFQRSVLAKCCGESGVRSLSWKCLAQPLSSFGSPTAFPVTPTSLVSLVQWLKETSCGNPVRAEAGGGSQDVNKWNTPTHSLYREQSSDSRSWLCRTGLYNSSENIKFELQH